MLFFLCVIQFIHKNTFFRVYIVIFISSTLYQSWCFFAILLCFQKLSGNNTFFVLLNLPYRNFLKYNYISFKIHHVPIGSGKSSNVISSFVIGCLKLSWYAHKAICFPCPLVPYFWSPKMLCPK